MHTTSILSFVGVTNSFKSLVHRWILVIKHILLIYTSFIISIQIWALLQKIK